MNTEDYRLENGYVLQYVYALEIGDACSAAMIIEKQPNGKYAVKGVSEVVAYPGFALYNNKLLNKDFKHAYVLSNDLESSYIVLEDENGWSLVRVDGDIRCYGGLVSTVTERSYASPLQMLLDHGFSFVKSSCSDAIELVTPERRKQPYRKGHIVCDGFTPDNILLMRPCDVFVFGSNPAGAHNGGAARMARKYFGARMGVAEGLQGQSYAIPTIAGNIESIKKHVDKFIEFAKNNKSRQFFVTRIGCGSAGYSDAEIAPLFKAALCLRNVNLPKSFKAIIQPCTIN